MQLYAIIGKKGRTLRPPSMDLEIEGLGFRVWGLGRRA